MTEQLQEIAGMVGGETRIAPAHGIATIALTMALKYHDINTVHDGTLYQQYKLEGKNIQPLHLDMIFETAILFESHLMASSERIARTLVEALAISLDDAEKEQETP